MSHKPLFPVRSVSTSVGKHFAPSLHAVLGSTFVFQQLLRAIEFNSIAFRYMK